MKIFSFTILALLTVSQIEGQTPVENDLALKSHPLDTSASAVILFDIGKAVADFNNGTKFSRHTRFKIFKRTALDDWGTFSLKIRKGKLKNFSAVIYNEVDGIIVKSFVDENLVLKSKNGETQVISIPFPNISEGSVVEFQYDVVHPEYYLPSWFFQYSIPVIKSEYTIFCPSIRGCQPDVIGQTDGLEKGTRSGGKEQWWRLNNIPAFKEEPYMPPQSFYRARLNYEFSVFFDLSKLLELQDSREVIKRNKATIGKSTVTANFTLENHNEAKGKVTITREGIDAATAREGFEDLGREKYYQNSISNPLITIVDGSILNEADTTKPFVENYEVELDGLNGHDSIAFFDPFILMKDHFNPFHAIERKYPVFFGSYHEEVVSYTYLIPDGYEIRQLPESKIIELPGGIIKSLVSVTSSGRKIFVTTKLAVNKPVFMPHEYPALRDFFNLVLEMKSKPVVLVAKKT